MSKYVYPAIFRECEALIEVSFPDLPDVFTSGKDLPEAFEMAEDVLNLMLYDKEESNTPVPSPSDIRDIKTKDGEICSLVCCDTTAYGKKYNMKSVKKNITIPAWLNTLAEKADINFSLVLQNGLKKELNL